MRAPEHAPRGTFNLHERRHGLAEIVERGAVVMVERHRVHQSHPEREIITVSNNASRHGYDFARECLSFIEALQMMKGRRVAEHAEALYKDASSTLDDLRESVATLEELNRTARRVLGNAHPLTTAFEGDLRAARAALGK